MIPDPPAGNPPTPPPPNLEIRLAGSMAALNREHPLTNPYLGGPDDLKTEWLVGYAFAQKLDDLGRARLRVAILERRQGEIP